MSWDRLGSVAQLGSPRHVSIFVKASLLEIADAADRERSVRRWETDNLVGTGSQIYFPLLSNSLINYLPVQGSGKDIMPHRALAFENWIYQAAWQTKQHKFVIMIPKWHRTTGSAVLKRVYSRWIPWNHGYNSFAPPGLTLPLNPSLSPGKLQADSFMSVFSLP